MIEYTVKVFDDQTEWYLNGKLHREDGPACEYANGTKCWYKNGLLHREDGPAIECSSGSKFWFLNGKRHRENGPAIEYSDGKKYWFIEGKRLTETEFLARSKPCSGKKVTVDGIDYTLT